MGKAIGVFSGMEEDALIRAIMRNLRIRQEADCQDAFQEGRLAVLIAKRAYDPVNGIPWPNFAAFCIRRRLRDWNRSRLKHGATDEPPEVEGREPEPVEAVALAELRGQVRRAVADLSKASRVVWEGFMDGEKQRDTARRIGRSQQAVNQAMERSGPALRYALGGRSATPGE